MALSNSKGVKFNPPASGRGGKPSKGTKADKRLGMNRKNKATKK